MIQFPCHCGHVFRVADDLAGGTIQCPDCKLLSDIPSLDDLPFLRPQDGTYQITDKPQEPDVNRLDKLVRAFSREKVDETGEEIDLRLTTEQILDAGDRRPTTDAEIPLAPLDYGPADQPTRPKYDPETGELIRPLAVKEDEPKAPVPAVPVGGPTGAPMLTYAPVTESVVTPATYWRLVLRMFVELFMPTNIVVMFFIFLFHVFIGGTVFMGLGGLIIVGPITLLVIGVILAHYGNTVEDMGPNEHAELPRPLRGMSWRDDVWDPFVHVAVAGGVAYWPAFMALLGHRQGPSALWAALGLAAVGTVAFPALLLTTATSGDAVNLRPDRVLKVIVVWGAGYVLAVILWLLTLAFYGAALLTGLALAVHSFVAGSAFIWFTHPVVVMTLTFLAICLAHLFCWYLGLSYRAYHSRFSWALQVHETDPRLTKVRDAHLARLSARRAATVGHVALRPMPPTSAGPSPNRAPPPLPPQQPRRRA